MRFLATKERARDRKEYAYMHRGFLSQNDVGIGKIRQSKSITDFIEKTRVDLGYSPKTATIDIWLSLQKTLNSIKHD